MSTRYKGSILSSAAAASSSTAAYGIWKQSEVAQLINNAWTNIDPNWTSVSMLLHGDGTAGAQNNTFIDSSSNAFTITRNGTATQGTYSPFTAISPYSVSVSGGSAIFNGTSDYLSIPANTAFSYTTGDFTWECWIYPLAYGASGSAFFAFYSNVGGSFIVGQCELFISSAGLVQFYYATTASATANISSASSVSLNAWSHIAVVRSGSGTGNLKLYINGAVAATSAGAVTQNLGSTGAGSIGRQTSGTAFYYNGYISNVRIVKGTAVYTSAFTPPTNPLTAISGTSLLLGFTNAGIIDNAMANNLLTSGSAQINTGLFKYGTGSISFNGTNSYLSVPNTSTSAFGSNNFTIEFWILASAIPAAGSVTLFDTRPPSTNGAYPLIYLNNDATIRLYVSSADRITSSVVSSNTWHHVAICRSSGSTKMFLNGTQTGVTYTDATTYLASTTFVAASYGGGASITGFLNGYIDELRITKGVARYTENFTAPQQAFPNQ